MGNRARLGAIFTSIVSTTLVLACSNDSEGGGLSTDGFEPICGGTEPNRYDPLAGVTAATPVDYMELRTVLSEGLARPTISSATGVACATATDKGKCHATLEAVRSEAGWSTGSLGRGAFPPVYLVYTHGDAVETITSIPALVAFVAPVDTVKDAALILTASDGDARVNCQKPVARKTASGFEIILTKGSGCGAGADIEEHRFAVTSTGASSDLEVAVVSKGEPNCTIGRIPEGLCPVSQQDTHTHTHTLGDHFARIARLEAASVVAFERLAEELASFEAPPELVRAARRSANDERRHAAATTRLARRFGGEPLAAEVAAVGERTLFDVALENAIEGCVRESYGALVSIYQARTATDDEIRREMQTIAEEETDHASLSWELHAWACTRLAPGELSLIEHARERAATDLALSLANEDVPSDVLRLSGHPPRERAVAMFEALRRTLLQS